MLFVLLPIVSLAALEGKFLNGTFYFSTTDEYSCLPDREPQLCKTDGAGLAHFNPAHGLRSIWDTPYRYEGNLTYLPPWQAIIWVALGFGVIAYAGLHLRLLLR